MPLEGEYAPSTAEGARTQVELYLRSGGAEGGTVFGRTDDFGYYVAENKVTMPDFHATILHLLGLDHERLTYRHAGRDFRLTDVGGKVLTKLLA